MRKTIKNFQPRVGIAWDPFKDGKTSVRAAYAILTDQPVTNVVTPLTSNPPLARPLTLTTGLIHFHRTPNRWRELPASAPNTVDPGFNNAYVQSWNLNIQREVGRDLGVTIGYFGTKGTHLRISRNINQPINGVRPFPTSFVFESDSPGCDFEQHRSDRRHRKLELQRALAHCQQASVARASVQCFVHVLEVDRLQLAEQPGRRRAGQLQPARQSRSFGFRREASLCDQWALRTAVPRQSTGRRLAALDDRAVAKWQSSEHRGQ